MRYLYVIKGADNHYKIGIAAVPERRLKELQTGNGHQLHLICTRLFEDAENVEMSLHLKFRQYAAFGGKEWFTLNPEQVIDLLQVIHELPDVKAIDELSMLSKIVIQANELNTNIADYIEGKQIKIPKTEPAVKSVPYVSHTDEELIELAKIVFSEAGKGSTSLLQRKLKIGYSKAARIMDILTQSGFLSIPDEMYHAREILVSK